MELYSDSILPWTKPLLSLLCFLGFFLPSLIPWMPPTVNLRCFDPNANPGFPPNQTVGNVTLNAKVDYDHFKNWQQKCLVFLTSLKSQFKWPSPFIPFTDFNTSEATLKPIFSSCFVPWISGGFWSCLGSLKIMYLRETETRQSHR